MSKIWLYFEGDYEDRHLVAAFSSEEKLREFHGNCPNEPDMESLEIDSSTLKPKEWVLLAQAEVSARHLEPRITPARWMEKPPPYATFNTVCDRSKSKAEQAYWATFVAWAPTVEEALAKAKALQADWHAKMFPTFTTGLTQDTLTKVEKDQ